MALKDVLYDCSGEEMRLIRLSQSHGPTLRFTGKMIGGYSTRKVDSVRWQEGEIFVTEGGSMIAVFIGISQVNGEKDLIAATVVEPGDETEMRIAVMDALQWTVPARQLARTLKWKLEREIA